MMLGIPKWVWLVLGGFLVAGQVMHWMALGKVSDALGVGDEPGPVA